MVHTAMILSSFNIQRLILQLRFLTLLCFVPLDADCLTAFRPMRDRPRLSVSTIKTNFRPGKAWSM